MRATSGLPLSLGEYISIEASACSEFGVSCLFDGSRRSASSWTLRTLALTVTRCFVGCWLLELRKFEATAQRTDETANMTSYGCSSVASLRYSENSSTPRPSLTCT